jgi:hypothetical protein
VTYAYPCSSISNSAIIEYYKKGALKKLWKEKKGKKSKENHFKAVAIDNLKLYIEAVRDVSVHLRSSHIF